jgi:glycosyltransferase involved in cell wall biosynthesis
MSSTCDSSAPGPHAPRARVAVVVSGWPRVSEVFAVHELLALHRAGMLAGIWATKPGETGPRQPQSVELDALVTVLPAGDVADQAAAMATQLAQRAPGVTGVHGYFAHDPAAVARRVAGLLGLPYSFSMHALDARKVTSADLAEQARHAAAVICCNPDVSVHVDGAERRPSLVRHGVDLARFTATDPPADPAASGPLELLAVGRLVAKKGFDVLLDAMSLVEAPVRLTVVGTGPLLGDLQSQIAARHLGDRVELAGRRTHETLPGEYARAQVVVVPSVVDTAGDRDGLPNVVLEAMASARPVIASDVAAVATAVSHGSTGLLVPPGDATALAAAVDSLADDPLRRLAMGLAGRAVVESDFDLDACTAQFCRSLEMAHG